MRLANLTRKGATWLTEIGSYEPRAGDRLRCLDACCRGPVTTRRGVGTERLVAFVHLPNTANRLCPYYHRSQWTPARAAMSFTISELLGTIDRDAFDLSELEARFAFPEGHGVLVYLTPDKARLFAEEGIPDGRHYLFVATLADLERIQRRHLDRIFATHQVLTMMPPDPDSDRASLRLTIASSRLTFSDLQHGLAGVDLVWVDWERFFGLELPICPIYVRRGYRDTVHLVSRLLADDELTAASRKTLRLIAKRLLVDGALVHRIVFRQESVDAARDVTLTCDTFPSEMDLVSGAELARVAPDRRFSTVALEDDLLSATYLDLTKAVGESESARRRQIESERLQRDQELATLRPQKATLESGLREAEREVGGLRAKLAREEERSQELEQQRSGLQRRVEETGGRVRELQQEVAARAREVDEAKERAARASRRNRGLEEIVTGERARANRLLVLVVVVSVVALAALLWSGISAWRGGGDESGVESTPSTAPSAIDAETPGASAAAAEEPATQTVTPAAGESPILPDSVDSGTPAPTESRVSDEVVRATAEPAEQELPEAPAPDEANAAAAAPPPPPAAAVIEATEPPAVAPSSTPPAVADATARATPVAILQRVTILIGDLDPDLFVEPRNRRDFTDRLVKALRQLSQGRRAKASKTVQGLLSRCDGCGLRGSPDVGHAEVRDWLTDCRSQSEVYDLLQRAMEGAQ